MKKLLCFSLYFFLQSSGVWAQMPKAEKAIRQLMAMQEDAWNRGDIAAFMEGYWKNDSLSFTGAAGPVYGWQKTYDGYLKRYDSPAKMGKLSFTLLQLKPLGKNYYTVVGKWHLERTVGNVGGHFTLILQRIGGEWRIIADHTS
ncbi:YybH family protein [Phnomibacter sp. MR]|uniref:YybH family protein n=1 Tax=Phnomibacter sp. MR TaxID=3042318 RepID=UPI003A7F88D6